MTDTITKIIFFTVIVVAAIVVFFPTLAVLAQEYVPLSPLPGSEKVDLSDPSSYFANIFGIAVGVAAMLAVIYIIIGGFQYMTSEAIGSKESAKKRMWAATLGLALILGSWLILNTINPNLLSLGFFKTFKQESSTIPTNISNSTKPNASK